MFQKCVSQVIYLLTLFIALGLLTNCAAPVTQRPAPQVHTLATIAPSAAPLMLGNCGHKLVFTKRPERVVTLGLPATELMLKLGLAKAIVGVGAVNNAAPLPELADAYRALPILTKSGGIPKEALLKVNPDLVIDHQPDYFYDAQQGFATVAELKTVDAQVYTMSAKCSGKADATVDDLYTDLWSLGKIFGVGEQAKVTIKELQERIDSVQAKVKGLPPVTVMYYETGEGPLNIAGPGAWQDVVNLAGGVNAFNDLPESHIQVSVEQVAARDADVFIVAGDTTHWASRNYIQQYCGANYVAQRFVQQGKIITAAGVSAGIDMALFLAQQLSNTQTAQAIQLATEYDPHPPLAAGDWTEANAELVAEANRVVMAYRTNPA